MKPVDRPNVHVPLEEIFRLLDFQYFLNVFLNLIVMFLLACPRHNICRSSYIEYCTYPISDFCFWRCVIHEWKKKRKKWRSSNKPVANVDDSEQSFGALWYAHFVGKLKLVIKKKKNCHLDFQKIFFQYKLNRSSSI